MSASTQAFQYRHCPFFGRQLPRTSMARLHKGLSAPTVKTRTIVADGHIVGCIAHFRRNDQPEVSYWIGRQYWGNGFATRALQQFLTEVEVRPLYVRAAKDNVGSI